MATMQSLLDTSKPLDINLLTQVVHCGQNPAASSDPHVRVCGQVPLFDCVGATHSRAL